MNYQKKNRFARTVNFLDCKKAVYDIFNNIVFIDKINISEYSIELHVVRHGQDEQDNIGGWSDNHLTDKGVEQALELSLKLENDYNVFISSDLNRAKETAEIINKKLKIKIDYMSAFREVNNGDLKNLTKEEFTKKYLTYMYSHLEMNQNYPNGESPYEFYERIKNNFLELLDKNKGKKILLLTHGGVYIVIYCLLNGLQYSNKLKIKKDFCSIDIFK